ncbi:MAG: hypothetical protein QM811_07295 [Pirellulales bacterium]
MNPYESPYNEAAHTPPSRVLSSDANKRRKTTPLEWIVIGGIFVIALALMLDHFFPAILDIDYPRR